MNIKQFIIAVTICTLASLGMIFGLAFLLAFLFSPPSGFGDFITRYLGQHGQLIVVITSFSLGTGVVLFCTRKLIVPRLTRKVS